MGQGPAPPARIAAGCRSYSAFRQSRPEMIGDPDNAGLLARSLRTIAVAVLLHGIFTISLPWLIVRATNQIGWLHLPLGPLRWLGAISIEERDLERVFGEEYLRYAAEVPRWIPRRSAWAVTPRD